MKKICAILSVAIFTGVLATAALAVEPRPKGTSASMAEQQTETGEKGELIMNGTVSKLDIKTGQVSVKTGQGTAKLYFAPGELKNLKVGDKVVVDLETAEQEAREHKK